MDLETFKKIINIILAAAFIILTPPIFGASDLLSTKQTIKKALSAELGARVSEEKFFIKVEGSLRQSALDNEPSQTSGIPFLPNTARRAGVPNASDLQSALQSIENLRITLYVDQSLETSEISTLKILLGDILDAENPDSVLRVQKVPFPKSSERQRLSEERDSIERKITDLENRQQELARERNDIANELTQTKLQLEQARAEFAASKSEQAGRQGSSEPPPSPATKKSISDSLSESISAFIIGGAILLFLFVALLTLRSSMSQLTKNLAAPFAQIANAIAESGSAGSESVIDVGVSEDGTSNAAIGEASSATLQRLESLRSELDTSLEKVDEIYTLHTLNQLLDSREHAAEGVYVMELMPREKAKLLFEKLGTKQKMLVTQFLISKTHPANKLELMLAAGEKFKTKLMQGHLGAIREHLSQPVLNKKEQLGEENLMAVMEKLESEAAMRFILHLDPEATARVLSESKTYSPKLFDKLSIGLATLSDFEERSDLDASIEQTIEEVMSQDQRNKEKKYLPLYKDVFSALDDDLTSGIIEVISYNKKSLGNTLANSIITVQTLFKLGSKFQLEVLESLSNREIALLTTMFSAAQTEKILPLFDSRRQDILRDEIDRMSQRSKIDLKSFGAATRKKLIARMEELRAEHGNLQSLSASEIAELEEPNDLAGESGGEAA